REHAGRPPAKAKAASSGRRTRGRAVPRPMLLYGRHDGIRPIVEIRPRAEALLAQASPTFSAVSLPVVPDGGPRLGSGSSSARRVAFRAACRRPYVLRRLAGRKRRPLGPQSRAG